MPVTESLLQHFRPISLDLFSYLWEVPTIDFSIYIHVENEVIEYIRPSELSHELLEHIWAVSLRSEIGIEVLLAKKDYSKFEHTISYVRQKKINHLIEKDPSLDRRTLETFTDLSGASQMILRGGISKSVAERVKSAAAYMVSQLMDNELAMSTLSRMITIDPTLYDHSASVAMFSTILAKQYVDPKLSSKEAEIISQCGLYHDAGKSCIPNAILNKPGSFTPDEFEVMKTHAMHGYTELMHAIAAGAPIDDLAARVALEHHERFAGGGYPSGKRGRLEDDPKQGIHRYSRIVAIADAYSALLMKRVYKPALSAETALEMLTTATPKDFDESIMTPFVHGAKQSLDKLREKKEKLKSNHIYVVDEHESTAKKIAEVRKAEKPEAAPQAKKPA